MSWIEDIRPGYFTVTGRFVSIGADIAGDPHPDVQPLNGRAVFTPTVTAGRKAGAFAVMEPVEARILGGALVDETDAEGVRLTSTDVDLGVDEWAWTVTYTLDDTRVRPPSVTIQGDSGATVSLTADDWLPVTGQPVEIVGGKTGLRINGVEGQLHDHAGQIATLDERVSTVEGAVTDLEALEAITPARWGVVGDGVTDDSDAIQAMLRDAPAGATIHMPDTYRLTRQVSIEKPVTITGGTWKGTPDGWSLRLYTGGVTLRDMSFTSHNSGPVTDHRVISGWGTAEEPLEDITIQNVSIHGSGYAGIWLVWTRGVLIQRCTLTDIRYAGIMLLSARDSVVRDCTVRDVTGTGYTDCYGVAVSDSTNDQAGRSRDVTVEGCTIERVAWEGIDTHGGLRIHFIGNSMVDCGNGIAVLSGNTTRVVPAEDCVVMGNVISRTDTGDDKGAIKFHGSQHTSRGPATGVISGNTIVGYGARPLHVWNVHRPAFRCGANTRPEVQWTTFTIADGWQTTQGPVQWMVDDGRVWMRGSPSKTAPTQGTTNTIATIPADYRPPSTQMLGVTTSQSANITNLRMTDDGRLQILHEADPAAGGGFHYIAHSYPLA